MVKEPRPLVNEEAQPIPPAVQAGGKDDLAQRVARLEHEVSVLTPLAELLPALVQIKRMFGGV